MWYFLYIYLTLLVGLRFEIGGDTINYMGHYDWQDTLDSYEFTFLNRFQPGYNLLCSITKTISPDFSLFQIVHSVIINTLIFIFIRRSTPYIFTTLFFMFFAAYFYFTCEILRESLAVMAYVFVYPALVKKQWFIYLIGVAIALMFHLSAVIMLLFPFLTWIKFDKKYLLIFIVFLVAMYFLRNILSMMESVDVVGEKVASYKEEKHGMLADILACTRKGLFPILFALLVKFGCKRRLLFENQVALLGLFGSMSFFNPVIFGRITNYLILFYILSFSTEMIDFVKSRKKSLLHNAVALSISFVLLYGSGYALYRIYQLYIPYESIINPIHHNRPKFA